MPKKTQYKIISLLSSNSIAIVIPLLCHPIISRLFSPEQIGEYSILQNSLFIVQTLLLLSLDDAIVKTRKREELYQLMGSSIYIIKISSIVIFLLLSLNYLFNLYPIKYSFTLQFSFIITAAISSITLLLNESKSRNKEFGVLAHNAITKSITTNLSKITFGSLSFGLWGLWLGTIIGNISTLIHHIIHSNRTERLILLRPKFEVSILKRHKHFILYQTLSTFVNNLNATLTLVVISHFYSLELSGQYAMAIGIMEIGIRVIANTYYPIMYKEAIEHPSSIIASLSRKILQICMIVIPPLIIYYFIGVKTISWVLSDKWEISAKAILLFTPTILIMTIHRSLLFIPFIYNKQKQTVVFNLLFTVAIGVATYLSTHFNHPMAPFIAMSIAYILNSLIRLLWYAYLLFRNHHIHKD